MSCRTSKIGKIKQNLLFLLQKTTLVTPGSGMRKKSRPGTEIKILDHISESLETISWIKILKFLDADPGSFWPWIQDPGWEKFGSGINIPVQANNIWDSRIRYICADQNQQSRICWGRLNYFATPYRDLHEAYGYLLLVLSEISWIYGLSHNWRRLRCQCNGGKKSQIAKETKDHCESGSIKQMAITRN